VGPSVTFGTCGQGLNDYSCAVPGNSVGEIREVSGWGVTDLNGLFNMTSTAATPSFDIVITWASVRDGLSNTLLFGEKRLRTAEYQSGS